MPYLKINGIKMAVETYGDMDKPALIMLHGGVCGQVGRHTWEFGDVAKKLSNDFFVIAYDRRGHGYTPFSGTFDDTASDVVAVMDALCLEKAFIAGYSAGTYIGGRTAILYPDRVAGLILMAPHSHAEGKTPANMLAERNNIAIADMGSPEAMKIMESAMWAPQTPEEVKKEFGAFNQKYSYIPPLSPEETAKAYKAMGWFDNREGFKTLQVPTLIFGGKYDGFCPMEEARSIHSLIQNSQYIEFEDASHGMLMEKTDVIVAAIKEFCSALV